jgi:hypothetical protein
VRNKSTGTCSKTSCQAENNMQAKRSELLEKIERDPQARIQLRRILTSGKRGVIRIGGEAYEIVPASQAPLPNRKTIGRVAA